MPTVEEMRHDPRARAEGIAAAQALDPQHLVEVVKTQKNEASESTASIRRIMEEDWRLYQSEVSWADKEDWQSKIWIPMPFTASEHAASIIARTFLESPDFFRVDGYDAQDKMVADQLLNPLIRLLFSKASFIPIFSDAVKVGFVTGTSSYLRFRLKSRPAPVVADVVYDERTGMAIPVYDTQRRQYLVIDSIPPFQVYRDPASRAREQWSGSYIMVEEYVSRAYLRSAERAGFLQNVEEVLEGSRNGGGKNSREDVARRRGQKYVKPRFGRDYVATEWWGDVPDENGDPILPDAWMMICEDTLIMPPRDCPVWAVDAQSGRRKWPLVAFSPMSHPFRFEGWGILRAVGPLAYLFSNLFNLFADGLNWFVNPPSEVDLSLLEDWYDLDNYPGKVWRKTGQGTAFGAATGGRMDASTILASLQYASQLFENNSLVTQFVMGLPGSRSNITKGEVQIKTSQSMGIFEGMGRNIEEGGARCVELTADLIAQYLTEFSDPAILEVTGPVAAQLLAAMPPAQRYRNLSGNFNFTFTGISTALQKSDQLGRLLQAASLAASGPYLGLTDPRELLSAIVDALGIRDKVRIQPVPMVPMPMVQQMLEGKNPNTGHGPGARGRRLEPPSIEQLSPTPNEMTTAVAS